MAVKFECPACGSTKYCGVLLGRYIAICYGLSSLDGSRAVPRVEKQLMTMATDRIRVFRDRDIKTGYLECHKPMKMIEEEIDPEDVKPISVITEFIVK